MSLYLYASVAGKSKNKVYHFDTERLNSLPRSATIEESNGDDHRHHGMHKNHMLNNYLIESTKSIANINPTELNFKEFWHEVDNVFILEDVKDNDTLVHKWKALVVKYSCVEAYLYDVIRNFDKQQQYDKFEYQVYSEVIHKVKEIQDAIYSMWIQDYRPHKFDDIEISLPKLERHLKDEEESESSVLYGNPRNVNSRSPELKVENLDNYRRDMTSNDSPELHIKSPKKQSTKTMNRVLSNSRSTHNLNDMLIKNSVGSSLTKNFTEVDGIKPRFVSKVTSLRSNQSKPENSLAKRLATNSSKSRVNLGNVVRPPISTKTTLNSKETLNNNDLSKQFMTRDVVSKFTSPEVEEISLRKSAESPNLGGYTTFTPKSKQRFESNLQNYVENANFPRFNPKTKFERYSNTNTNEEYYRTTPKARKGNLLPPRPGGPPPNSAQLYSPNEKKLFEDLVDYNFRETKVKLATELEDVQML